MIARRSPDDRQMIASVSLIQTHVNIPTMHVITFLEILVVILLWSIGISASHQAAFSDALNVVQPIVNPEKDG